MRIVIVGAGVAGCIIARALSRLPGAEVTCLERVARDDQSEAGTGLNLGPNAVQALQACDAALVMEIAAASLPWRSWKVSLTDGTCLFDLPLGRVANSNGWRIRWSELYRLLRNAAAPAISYGCEITQIGGSVANSTETFVEWTENGAARRLDNIDLLIATDGRYSQIRRAISGEAAVRHVGVAISRVLVQDTSAGLIDDYEQWFNGPNRLLAFRVLPGHIYIAGTLPIEPGLEISERLKVPDALRHAFTPSSGIAAVGRPDIDRCASACRKPPDQCRPTLSGVPPLPPPALLHSIIAAASPRIASLPVRAALAKEAEALVAP